MKQRRKTKQYKEEIYKATYKAIRNDEGKKQRK